MTNTSDSIQPFLEASVLSGTGSLKETSTEDRRPAEKRSGGAATQVFPHLGTGLNARLKLVADVGTHFPAELRDRNQWVCWKLETRNNRLTKVPYSPVSGRWAASTVASTWGSFYQAEALLEAFPELTGLGYMFSADDPYCGIDFDHCIDPATGEIAQWALDWVERLKSYTEYSPSGTGLHVIACGQLSGKGRKKDGIEIYDRARYFTVTGRPFPGMPPTVEEPQDELAKLYEALASKKSSALKDRLALRQAVAPELPDQEVINAILASRSKKKFLELWGASWQERYGSQSEADLALTGLLAEYVGNNPSQIDRLFRQSKLYRDKWDETRGENTYGELTIALALGDGE